MSFLEELRRKKDKLKQTVTVVTNADGRRYLEGEGKQQAMTSLPPSYGFVVDTKPDDVPVLIANYVYIGSQDCAVDNILKYHNIKNVLSLGVNADVSDVEHKFVQCLDLPETDIVPVLKECLPFIHTAVDKKRNVLIHCNAGVSRTSMVAIAYLQSTGLKYDSAYSLVKSKRPAVQPNAGFVRQLRNIDFSEML